MRCPQGNLGLDMDHMELEDFVRTTIVGIMRGVRNAMTQAEEVGGHINPRGPLELRTKPEAMEFDVAITVVEATEHGGKAKISVAGFSVGGGLDKNYQNQSVSRVRFNIPVSWPSVESRHTVATKSIRAEGNSDL